MDSRTLKDVVFDFVQNQMEEKILADLLELHASTQYPRIKHQCQALIACLTSNSASSKTSTESMMSAQEMVLYLFHQINAFLNENKNLDENDSSLQIEMQTLKDILIVDLGMDPKGGNENTAWHEAEIHAYPEKENVNELISEKNNLFLSPENPDSISNFLNSDQFKIKLIQSEVYSLIILFINALKISKDETVNLNHKRAAYWENFIHLFDPNNKVAETWYLELRFYYQKREFEMYQRLGTQKTQNRNRNDDRHPIAAILESSKIKESKKIKVNDKEEEIDSFMLMSLFVRFLNDFLKENHFSNQIIPQQYQYATFSEKNHLLLLSAREQFKRDVKIMERGIMHPIAPNNPLTRKRTNIRKRIFLMLQGCADVLLKNVGSSSTVPLYQTNINQNLDEVMPLASILGHGGRTLIEIPPIQEWENPNQLLHWLLGGSDEVFNEAVLPNNYLAEQAGKVVYNRKMATHSLDYIFDDTSKQWHVTEIAPKNFTHVGTLASDLLGGRHFGFELSLMREDQVGPANGAYGHCYLYFLPPTKEKPGGLLIGFEGSAFEITSYYGQSHDSSGSSKKLSLTGGTKFAPDKHHPEPSPFDGSVIRPDSLNGIKYTFTKTELKELMLRTADDFKPEQLKKPAGSYLPALASKPAPKRFNKFIHYADPEISERVINATIKLTQSVKQSFTGTVGQNYSAMPTATSQLVEDEGVTRVENAKLFYGGHLTEETVSDLKLNNPNVKIIQIAILNMFEFASTTGITPIPLVEIDKYNIIKRNIFPMDDNAGDKYSPEEYLNAMHTGTIFSAAKAIHKAVKQAEQDKDTIVYVNCKSGFGRSTLMMVVYYALFSEVEPFTFMRINSHYPSSLLLKKAVEYVKQFREEADLHEHYFKTLAEENNVKVNDLWEKLNTDPVELEQITIKNRFGQNANIGKLRLAYNTIEQERKNPKLDDQERDYASEFFWDQFVQLKAYKSFIMYCVILDANIIKRAYEQIAGHTPLSQLIKNFFSLLETHPEQAIKSIKRAQDPNDANYNLVREILMTAIKENNHKMKDAHGYAYKLKEILNYLVKFINQYDSQYGNHYTLMASNSVSALSSSTSDFTPQKKLAHQQATASTLGPKTTASVMPLVNSTAQNKRSVSNLSAPARLSTSAPTNTARHTGNAPPRPKMPAPSRVGFLSTSTQMTPLNVSGQNPSLISQESKEIINSQEWTAINSHLFSLGNTQAGNCLKAIEELIKQPNHAWIIQFDQARQCNYKTVSEPFLISSSSASSSISSNPQNVFCDLFSKLKNIDDQKLIALFDDLYQKFCARAQNTLLKKA